MRGGEEAAMWGDAHMVQRYGKYLGYSAREVARPTVRNID